MKLEHSNVSYIQMNRAGRNTPQSYSAHHNHHCIWWHFMQSEFSTHCDL